MHSLELLITFNSPGCLPLQRTFVPRHALEDWEVIEARNYAFLAIQFVSI